MKSTRALLLFSILTASATAGPVLLATGGGTQSVTLPGLIDTVTLNGVLRLQRHVTSEVETYDLFDGLDTIVSLGASPITVSDSIGSIIDDPDFGAFQSLLTNGTDFESIFLFDPVVGVISTSSGGGGESQFLELLVPPLSDADLFGYEIQRIDRIATYEVRSSDDGLSTEVSLQETVKVLGVPEPSTLVLGIAGWLALCCRRKPAMSR